MATLNKVFLMGNLTRDPELRYVPSGTAVTTFTVAANRAYTMASGEKREETCFVRVVAWARQAELCSQYLSKGSPVFVEGRLQSRSWEAPDGQKRSTIEVVAQRVQFLGRAPKAAQSATGLGGSAELGGGEAAEPVREEAAVGAEEPLPEAPPAEPAAGPADDRGAGEVPF